VKIPKKPEIQDDSQKASKGLKLSFFMNKASLPVEVRKARTPKPRIPANQMLVVN